MSVEQKAVKQGMWLALFKFISQAFSWVITLIVARLLVPEDYGLMSMATILTGYIQIFYQIGLGAAIIQREEITKDELSSLFWFVSTWGFFLAILCLILAYPTVYIFSEPRLLRITQAVSLIFIFGSLMIVPFNLLHREMKFKAVGFLEAASVIISCVAMLIMANAGFGVWTLIGGHIIREFAKMVLSFTLCSFRPDFYFNFTLIKQHIKFGANIVGAGSIHYLYSKGDTFFGGRAFSAHMLGYYSLAQQLANIPNDKIVSLIGSVSFPVFSRYQNEQKAFNDFYLKLLNAISTLTFPLYTGGIILADSLIPAILGDKWIPCVIPFQLLCAGQMINSILVPNTIANNAQNRPSWSLAINAVNLPFMLIGFYYFSSLGDINYLCIPWVVIFITIQFIFAVITIKKLCISASQVLKSIAHPFLASLIMTIVVLSARSFLSETTVLSNVNLAIIVICGACCYALYFATFCRETLKQLKVILKK